MTRRKPISAAIKRAILARSGGMCEAPGCSNVGKEFEHRIPVALGGINGEGNLWLACRPCHAEKTATQDIPRIAKAKRQAGETGQQKRRKTGGSKWPKGRKQDIPSRGFDKRFTRTIASKNKPSKAVKRQATKSNREVTFK